MENENRHIPNNLEYFRRQQRLSQGDVAEILDIACRSNVSKWERGHQFPTALDLIKLSILYKTNPFELYPGHTEALQTVLADRQQGL